MKPSLCITLCFVFGFTLLSPFAASAAPAPPAAVAREKAIAISTRKLQAIHAALLAWEKKYGRWPDHLSDLVPEFLPDAETLRDPADPGTGDPGSNMAHTDPHFRVSYSWERNGKISNGLACPLGRFPKPDKGDIWGTWRLVNGHQEYFWGDQVPLVRCFLHRPSEAEREDGKDRVLNLTPSGRIYESSFDWADHPDSVEWMLRTLARDLRGGYSNLVRHWTPWRVNEYLSGQENILAQKQFAPHLTEIAERLMAFVPEAGKDARPLCQLAALCELKLGRSARCLAALDEAARHPGAEWAPVVDDQRRAEAHHAAKNYAEEAAVYRRLLEKRPNVSSYLEGLAGAMEAMGDKDAATALRAKADPGAALTGAAAPDFTLPLVTGEEVTLKSALAGKKALLLNFWFLGCGPCRVEMPHLQELLTRHAASLGMVCVNRGDTVPQITKFAKEKQFTLPFAVGKDGAGKENAVFADWHVAAYPTNYLIGADGKVLWRGVGFGAGSLKALEKALADAGVQ